jgi:Flp pilus assembly secretin CpaC
MLSLPRQIAPASQFRGATLISAVFAAIALLAPGSAKAADEPLIVTYDQSKLLRLPRPAAEIIIGNPAIADVSVQAGNLLVITGKSFGTTNIIVLDSDRNPMQDQIVKVGRERYGVVNLVRGSQRQSLSCTPECHPALMIGDELGHFNHIKETTNGKMGISEKAADSAAASGGAGQ